MQRARERERERYTHTHIYLDQYGVETGGKDMQGVGLRALGLGFLQNHASNSEWSGYFPGFYRVKLE